MFTAHRRYFLMLLAILHSSLYKQRLNCRSIVTAKLGRTHKTSDFSYLLRRRRSQSATRSFDAV